MKSLTMSSLHPRPALSLDSPCERHRALCLAAEHRMDPDPARCRRGPYTDIVSGNGLVGTLSPSEGGHVALGQPGSLPADEEPPRHSARPWRFPAPFCRQNIRLWESSPKFAGAAFRRRFKAKLANKKPLVDKRALQVNNWLSSLNP